MDKYFSTKKWIPAIGTDIPMANPETARAQLSATGDLSKPTISTATEAYCDLYRPERIQFFEVSLDKYN